MDENTYSKLSNLGDKPDEHSKIVLGKKWIIHMR